MYQTTVPVILSQQVSIDQDLQYTRSYCRDVCRWKQCVVGAQSRSYYHNDVELLQLHGCWCHCHIVAADSVSLQISTAM